MPEVPEPAAVAGLHALAALFEAGKTNIDATTLHEYCLNAEDLRRRRREMGGRWEKDTTSDEYFNLSRSFGPLTYVLFTSRNLVCERKVIGTETVEVEERDPDLVAKAVEHIPVAKRTVTREIVEWVCPDSILSDDDPAVKADAPPPADLRQAFGAAFVGDTAVIPKRAKS